MRGSLFFLALWQQQWRGPGLTGPWQVKESPSASSHWPSHSTHTDPLAYSRISLSERKNGIGCREKWRQTYFIKHLGKIDQNNEGFFSSMAVKGCTIHFKPIYFTVLLQKVRDILNSTRNILSESNSESALFETNKNNKTKQCDIAHLKPNLFAHYGCTKSKNSKSWSITQKFPAVGMLWADAGTMWTVEDRLYPVEMN